MKICWEQPNNNIIANSLFFFLESANSVFLEKPTFIPSFITVEFRPETDALISSGSKDLNFMDARVLFIPIRNTNRD